MTLLHLSGYIGQAEIRRQMTDDGRKKTDD
jgi:hypothetical protein